jgi:hypothetical protein
MLRFDRRIFFDSVRPSLFSGSLSQRQVDGMNAILAVFEARAILGGSEDLRHAGYPLATAYHECSQEMWPISEYGAPECGGAEYAEIDPETGNRFYGRGLVQLTWKDNYERATNELHLTGANDLVRHPEQALDPRIASAIMYRGMTAGWFRTHEDGKPETLDRYFSDTVDDAYFAREIINGDKTKVPSWSNGVSIGNLIAGYHEKFVAALDESMVETDWIPPTPSPVAQVVVRYRVESDAPVSIVFQEGE